MTTIIPCAPWPRLVTPRPDPGIRVNLPCVRSIEFPTETTKPEDRVDGRKSDTE